MAELRLLTLSRPFDCVRCKSSLPVGSKAYYNIDLRAVACLDCGEEIWDLSQLITPPKPNPKSFKGLPKERKPKSKDTSVRGLIDSKELPTGGWSQEQLAEWGVPYPPPTEWRKQLIKTGIPFTGMEEKKKVSKKKRRSKSGSKRSNKATENKALAAFERNKRLIEAGETFRAHKPQEKEYGSGGSGSRRSRKPARKQRKNRGL